MRIIASLVLLMLAAMAMTCDEHGKGGPDADVQLICEGCPQFADCCKQLHRCGPCHPIDAGPSDVAGD